MPKKRSRISKIPVVRNIISSRKRNQDDRFIPDMTVLKRVVSMLKELGYRIVLTQGVYDITHKGHWRYLEAAKEHGDLLIVGVDSDELTKKRKQLPGGPRRPFDPLSDRVEGLLHQRHVDIVTVRNVGHRLEALVENIRPDVLILSATTEDIKKKHITHLKRFCGEVKILAPQADTSSTARLRSLMFDGASQLAEDVRVVIEKHLSFGAGAEPKKERK